MAVYKGTAYAFYNNGTGSIYFGARLGEPDTNPSVREDGPNWDIVASNAPLTFRLQQVVSGLTPPSAPQNQIVELRHADTNIVAASIQVGNISSVDLYLTSDGTATGIPLIGDFRIYYRAWRTTVPTYDVNSENGDVDGAHRGVIRVSPTSLSVQMSHSGAADPASYADNIQVSVDLSHGPGQDLSHRHFDVKAVNAVTATVYATQRTTGTDPQTASVKVNNRFPAMQVSVNIDVEVVAVPSTIAPTSQPGITWIVIPAGTVDMVDSTRVRKGPVPVDATLWMNHHLQVNSGTYDPLLDRDNRLTADLGFATTRVTNARGMAVSGITYRGVMRDQGNLVAPAFDRTVTTNATGMPPTMAPWDSQLPGGIWLHETVITGPTDAVGLEFDAAVERTLIAANPALSMICGAGPSGSGNDVRHIEPGMTVLIGLTVLDVFARKQVAVDAGSARAALCRFNLTFGRAEFFDSDSTWKPINGAVIHFWSLAASAGDPNTHTRTFTGSETWGVADLFVVGEATVAGAPLTNFMKEVVVSGVNNHDAYRFDGPALFGFPTR